MNHPLLPLPARALESDGVYAVLGRALAYATEFEENCRALAHLFDIEKTQTEFSYEVAKLIKTGTLYDKVELLTDRHQLPDWTVQKIHDARKARNYIAHEASKDHQRMMSSKELIKSFESTIVIVVGEIAAGNQIVLDVTRLLREGKRGHGSDMNAYSFAVASWISSNNF